MPSYRQPLSPGRKTVGASLVVEYLQDFFDRGQGRTGDLVVVVQDLWDVLVLRACGSAAAAAVRSRPIKALARICRMSGMGASRMLG